MARISASEQPGVGPGLAGMLIALVAIASSISA